VKLELSNHTLDFSNKTYLMGVLNVTPDSFSDGGLHFYIDRAVEHAVKLVEDGADIIDIGGESTRPGSEAVSTDEEIRRTIPVIESVARRLAAPISIDTCKAEVALRAIDAGASIVNDISGLRFDPAMAKAVASRGVPVIIMHIKGIPRDMQENPVYEALVPEIMDYLRTSIRMAVEAGIREDMIVVDPGIGFGKTFDHNLQVLRDLNEFTAFGKPIAIGVSRKAFIGKVLGGAPTSERLEGTAAAVAISIINGANIVRVHDVKEIAKVVKVADAIKKGSL
jgi:dihydropteroate synthase